ncbi:hypothetical protein GF318_03815 [Candidatus Micrarchaeota archaeon]|nr:hypothetical protein [Candidatus Micrarchaeota archaeon]
MNVLGWRILDKGDYFVGFPALGREEKELVAAAEERFKEATRTREAKGREESEGLIEEMVISAAGERGIFLGKEQQDYVCMAAVSQIYGFAFLEELLSNPEIEEISVIGPEKPVFAYFRRKGWNAVNACFDDEKAIEGMINRLSRPLGRHITMQNPRIDATLPDGSRLHASLPPVSGGEITIRKFRDRPFSPKELAMNGTVRMEELALLSLLMQCDLSVIVAGNTASGKTTTMNALFTFVPADERVIIAEETPEINVPHEHQLRLLANREMGIELRDLVYDSLRMRPDRMVVGEIRNQKEAEALFDVLLAGQARGSYATMHAQSAEEALSRLKSFGIPRLDLESIDCIVVQRRMLQYDPGKRKNTETRKVVEIAEVDNGVRPVFRKTGETRLLEKIAESFSLEEREIREELKKRKRLLASAPDGYAGFYAEIQERLFGGCR